MILTTEFKLRSRNTYVDVLEGKDITDQHGLQLHAVGWLNASTILESLD